MSESDVRDNDQHWQPFSGEFREGVEYRSKNDEVFTYVHSDGCLNGFPHECQCQHGPMYYSDGGTACNGYTDFDITHQRLRHAETGEGVKTTKDFAEYLRHECEGNSQLAAAVETEREVIRAGIRDSQPAAVERFKVHGNTMLPGERPVFASEHITEGEYVRAADYDALQERCEQLTEHELQTHERLGAILGTDDSLEECAKRLKERCEAAERELADCVTALGASPPQDDFPYWAIQDVGQFNSARECWPALAKEWRAQLATLTAENDRLAGELEAVKAAVDALLDEVDTSDKFIREHGITHMGMFTGERFTIRQLKAALSPAAGVRG